MLIGSIFSGIRYLCPVPTNGIERLDHALMSYRRSSVAQLLQIRAQYTLFFHKNLFYKNVEAEINQNFKNIAQAESRLRTFLFC